MCGIFGLITSENSGYEKSFLEKSFTKLAKLSQSRGKDSSGISILNEEEGSFNILKGALAIEQLINDRQFNNLISKSLNNFSNSNFLMGHARLVTNGTQLSDNNNQPIIKGNTITIHNGIIANVDELWRKHSELDREYEIDTELLPLLLIKYINNGFSLNDSIAKIFHEIQGTAAIAINLLEHNKLILATNYGCLYSLHNNKDYFIFASEYQILRKLLYSVKKSVDNPVIEKIESNEGIVVSYRDFNIEKFSLNDSSQISIEKSEKPPYKIKIIPTDSIQNQLSVVHELNYLHLSPVATKEKKLLEFPIEQIKTLRRCTNCILPETFPFITYNEGGICNYCINYNSSPISKSLDDLLNLVEPYRKPKGLDVLLPISGGRDSIYTLHLMKEKLKMNPITYTYDWGMVTDLARRNIARICGQLGVENIIIAADIHWKRENIRKNILAWLNHPEIGIIPLFMAGDKYFYYYAHKVKKALNIDLEVWGINRLENTNFKTGFCGLKPEYNKRWNYSLSYLNQLRLLKYYAFSYLKNPGYINQSVFDTIGSFASRYITPKANHIQLFDYYQWNEAEVEDTIINEYGWEKAVDTKSTWRIGDGTASFYNYIYFLVAGFTENDTFRSNQIREGMISRNDALELVMEENLPRYNSIKWYLEILDLDYKNIIETINQIKRLY